MSWLISRILYTLILKVESHVLELRKGATRSNQPKYICTKIIIYLLHGEVGKDIGGCLVRSNYSHLDWDCIFLKDILKSYDCLLLSRILSGGIFVLNFLFLFSYLFILVIILWPCLSLNFVLRLIVLLRTRNLQMCRMISTT